MISLWNAGQVAANFAWHGADTTARAASSAFSALPHQVQDGLEGLAWAGATLLPLCVTAHAHYQGHCHIPQFPGDQPCGNFGGFMLAMGFPGIISTIIALKTCCCFSRALYGRLPPHPLNVNIQGFLTRTPVCTQVVMNRALARRQE